MKQLLSWIQVVFTIGLISVVVGKQSSNGNCEFLQNKTTDPFIITQHVSLEPSDDGWLCFKQNLASETQKTKFDLNILTYDESHELITQFQDNNVLLLVANSPIEDKQSFMKEFLLKKSKNVITADFNNFFVQSSNPSLYYVEREGDFEGTESKIAYFYLIYGYNIDRLIDQKDDKNNKFPEQILPQHIHERIEIEIKLNLNPNKSSIQDRYFSMRPPTIINTIQCHNYSLFKCSFLEMKLNINYDYSAPFSKLFISGEHVQEQVKEGQMLSFQLTSPGADFFYRFIDDSFINNILPIDLLYQNQFQDSEHKQKQFGNETIGFNFEQFKDPNTGEFRNLAILITSRQKFDLVVSIETQPKKSQKQQKLRKN